MEILVAVAIVGILGAITVPRYQQYMKDTQLTAKDNSLRNIARAFSACTALKGLNNCDTLSELGVTSVSSNNAVTVVPSTAGVDRICLEVENTIAGVDIKSCVQADVQGGITFTSNQGFCFKDSGTTQTLTAGTCGNTAPYPCTANWDDACAVSCGDTKKDGTMCSIAADCPTTHNACKSASAGTCASGTCS